MVRRQTTDGSITITTTISRTLYDKAHNKIQWSEALRRGLITILAEQGDEDYINPLQLQRKMAAILNKLEETSQENYKLNEELNKYRGVLK